MGETADVDLLAQLLPAESIDKVIQNHLQRLAVQGIVGVLVGHQIPTGLEGRKRMNTGAELVVPRPEWPSIGGAFGDIIRTEMTRFGSSSFRGRRSMKEAAQVMATTFARGSRTEWGIRRGL